MRDIILKWALKNAIVHEGQAQVGAVIPKVIGEQQDAKKNIKEWSPLVKEIVSEVNNMSVSEQTNKLKEIAPELLEQKPKEQKPTIDELPNAQMGKVVMMFPPEPSKFPLIGTIIYVTIYISEPLRRRAMNFASSRVGSI